MGMVLEETVVHDAFVCNVYGRVDHRVLSCGRQTGMSSLKETINSFLHEQSIYLTRFAEADIEWFWTKKTAVKVSILFFIIGFAVGIIKVKLAL